MRIAFPGYVNPTTADVRLFYCQQWEAMGHEVLLVPFEQLEGDWTSQYLRSLLAGKERKTLFRREVFRECKQFRPDVVIAADTLMSPRLISKLRRKLGCLVGIELQQNSLLVGFCAQMISMCDFVMIHDSYLFPVIQGSRWGRNPNVFFMGTMAEPREHRPVSLSEEDQHDYAAEIAFIGGSSENRVEALRRLTQYDLRIWGDAEFAEIPELAKHFRSEPVYGLKKTKIYNATKIVLNVEDSEKQVNSINCRIPEVFACGGFVLTDWHKDLDRTPLVEGESVVSFRSLDEMAEKVQYYLTHSEERRAISRRGREISLDHLTYRQLAEPLATQMQALLDTR